MPWFLANSFFGLRFSFCSNQLNLSEYTRLEHKKHNLSPKNCLLEIKACNLEIDFIHVYNTLVDMHFTLTSLINRQVCPFIVFKKKKSSKKSSKFLDDIDYDRPDCFGAVNVWGVFHLARIFDGNVMKWNSHFNTHVQMHIRPENFL